MVPRTGPAFGRHVAEGNKRVAERGALRTLVWHRQGEQVGREGGRPSYPLGANPISPEIGSLGPLTFPTRGAHLGGQFPSLSQGEGTFGPPCALASPALALHGRPSISFLSPHLTPAPF